MVELLIVVVIIGLLTSMALPNYIRAVEKSRAAEAMNMIKNINDAAYAYAAERGICPAGLSKLLITVPGTPNGDKKVRSKDFEYELDAADADIIPGTSCHGTMATRLDSAYEYKLWNPYRVIDPVSKKRTLACAATNEKGIGICKALGIYLENTGTN